MPIVLGFAGYSGSGKTTLICRLLPLLRAGGLRAAVIKHDAHGLGPESPDKDSQRFLAAGADAVLLVSAAESRLLRPGTGAVAALRGAGEPGLPLRTAAELLPDSDVILVEGFKAASIPKIGLACFGRPLPGRPEDYLAVLRRLPENPAEYSALLQKAAILV